MLKKSALIVLIIGMFVLILSCDRAAEITGIPSEVALDQKAEIVGVLPGEFEEFSETVCVRSPGYWKNNPEAWPVEVEEIIIENPWNHNRPTQIYSKEEALEYMNMPVKGDKSITMFKAFVAAYLNIKNGAEHECIDFRYDEARFWLTIFLVGSGVDAKSEAWQYSHGELIYYWLDLYNNGELCAPACE